MLFEMVPLKKRTVILVFCGLLVTILVPVFVSVQSENTPSGSWRKITGNQLDERFSGMTFFGSVPIELAESNAFGIRAGRIMYYDPNGELLTAGGWNHALRGTWRVKDSNICHINTPSKPNNSASNEEDCWSVYEGENGILLWRSSKDQWVGTLSPGNQACQQVTEQSNCTN